MEINLTEIIGIIVGLITSGGIGALISIKYANKKAKIEVKSDDNKEQSERIDLGSKYVESMLQMLEKIQDAQANNSSESKDSWKSVEKKMNEIHDDLVGVKKEVTSIVGYLNGGYQRYKDEHGDLEVLDNMNR